VKGAAALACVVIAFALAGCTRPSAETDHRSTRTIIGCVGKASDGYLVSFETTCSTGHGIRGTTSDAGALRSAATIAAATLNCARTRTCTPPLDPQLAGKLEPARFALFTTSPEGTTFVFKGDPGELVELFVDANGNVALGNSFPETD